MVERLNGIQEVRGSNPLTSTRNSSPTRKSRAFFVYILQSTRTGRFYIGHCDHLIERFHEHQAGYSAATRNRGPWWLPYFEIYDTRGDAQKREYALKRKKSAKYLRWLIHETYPSLELH